MFLFRISVTATDGWSPFYKKSLTKGAIKPIYFVAADKEAAAKWAESTVKNGLKVVSISKLARQLAPHVYSGNDI